MHLSYSLRSFVRFLCGNRNSSRNAARRTTTRRHSAIESLERRELLTEFVVTTSLDDSTPDDVLSLREAIASANANEGADTIVFSSSLSGQSFFLTQSQLDITDPVTITGLGALNTTIDAQTHSRVFNITNAAGDVTIEALTIRGGLTELQDASGAGIRYQGLATLTLIDSAVTVNATTGLNSQGAGIASGAGNILLINSTVSGNSTGGTNAPGGGIATGSGNITLINSTVSSNATGGTNSGGGGISTFNGNIKLTNSTVAFNLTSGPSSAGGGIFSNGTGGASPTNVFTINNSIVAKNASGSGTSEDISKSTGTTAVTVNNSLIGVNTGSDLAAAPVGSPDANGNLIGTSAAPIDPRLAALATNGGTTRTHALLNTSPAIDAGNNSLAVDQNGDDLTFDQAGQVRIFHTTVDMGAFEIQSVSATPTVSFNQSSQSAGEGAGSVTLTVTLSAASNQTVTIPFSVTGTATNGADYTITNSPITIAAGATSGTITVNISDDGAADGNETVVVTLGTPTNATLGSTTINTLTITDNDNGAPSDITLSANTVAENVANAVVGNLTVTDPDSNNTATFTIQSGGEGNLFVITGNQLKVGSNALNYEALSGGVATVTIRATDSSGLFLDEQFTINVTDVNEAPTVTSGQTLSVSAGAPNNTSVGTVVAADPDVNAPNNTLTYSIVGGNTSNAFAINSSSGLITVANSSAVNTANGPSFSLQVRATDGGNPALSSTQTVTVNVVTGNQAPTIPAGQTFSIADNAAANAVVGTVSASDPDPTAPNNTLTFSITGGNTGNAFAINSSTGQITVLTPGALDAGTTPSYSLQVQVADGGNPSLTFTRTVTINVTEPNNAPSIPAGQSFTIAENSAPNTTVGTVTATDPDGSAPNNVLSFSIIGGNTNNAFAINSSTGAITVAVPSAVNFEATPQFTLQVRVTDGGSPALSATQTVTVQVTNVNEPPSISPNQTFTVQENAPNNTVVGTVVAADPDGSAPQNTLTYSIQSGNPNSAFAINPTTGQLTVNNSSALTFANGTFYSLQVRVADGGNPSLSDTRTVTVTLFDVNQPPTIPAGQTFNIAENTPASTPVGTVAASDPDPTAPSNTLTYSIVGGNTSSAFVINAVTGLLSVSNSTAVNFETNPQFTLQIQVTDGGSPQLSATQTVTINVSNVNEAPVIPAGQSFAVAEQAPLDTVVGTLTASDPDATAPDNSITYSIVSGNTGGAFAINPSTGEISVNNSAALDATVNPQFTLQVKATDGGNPALSATQSVSISVTDANAAPSILSGQVFSINENRPSGTVVDTVAATDPDASAPNNTLTYSIVGGNSLNVFSINPTTGQLTINVPAGLNFEVTPQFNLQIKVTDGGTPALTATNTVTINVNDINEAPVIAAGQNFVITEQPTTNSVVGTVAATDPDTSAPANSVTYAITAGNTGNAFTINPTTGQISVVNPNGLNFETTPSTNLQVSATDGGGLSSSQIVTISLTDVNESPTIPAGQVLTVPEGSPVNTVVGTVAATDPDTSAPNNSLAFAIVGGNTGGTFAIDPVTGQITVANPALLDLSTPSFTLQISVTDGGSPQLSTTQSVTVNVGNVNEAPVLSNSGDAPVYIRKLRQDVIVLPNITVSDADSSTDLAQVIISLPIPPGRKNLDVIGLSGASALGSVTDKTVQGRRQITLTLNSGVTNAQVQSFLRGITFSTKGKGLRLNQRDFQVQVIDRQGGASNVITQNVQVRRK